MPLQEIYPEGCPEATRKSIKGLSLKMRERQPLKAQKKECKKYNIEVKRNIKILTCKFVAFLIRTKMVKDSNLKKQYDSARQKGHALRVLHALEKFLI